MRRRLVDRHNDEGSVTVLTIGLIGVLLAAVVTVAAITHVQLQRARLAHVADETALAAADAIDLDAYYAAGVGEGPATLDPDRLADEAREHFAASAARQGMPGAILTRASSPDGTTVEVSVALSTPVLFGADWLPGRVALTATASALATP